jgi:hypothetical protein
MPKNIQFMNGPNGTVRFEINGQVYSAKNMEEARKGLDRFGIYNTAQPPQPPINFTPNAPAAATPAAAAPPRQPMSFEERSKMVPEGHYLTAPGGKVWKKVKGVMVPQ